MKIKSITSSRSEVSLISSRLYDILTETSENFFKFRHNVSPESESAVRNVSREFLIETQHQNKYPN